MSAELAHFVVPRFLCPFFSRQDSWRRVTRSLDYRVVKPRDKSVVDVVRAVSVPPRPILSPGPSLMTNSAREPAYWGIAYPLNHEVLYPQPGNNRSIVGISKGFELFSEWSKNPLRISHILEYCNAIR